MSVRRALTGATMALILAAGIAAPANAAIIFTGDFETGNHGQWPLPQFCSGDYSTVTSPVQQGSYAGRFSVPDNHAFPNCAATSGNPRAQLATNPILLEGKVYRNQFYVRFDSLPLQPIGSWYVVAQMFGQPFTNSPPVAIHVKNIGGANRFTLEIAPNNTSTTQTIWQSPPITLGTWHWFRITERYSKVGGPSAGWVSLRYNGAYQQLPGGTYQYPTNTMDPDVIGAYRFYVNSYRADAAFPGTITSYFDNAHVEQLP